jgi:AcrR family transcriptional regulator
MERKTYHHGDLKTALVEAGIDILEAEGLKGLSLRSLAARVGVSHTAPKNHFGAMRGLLTALAAEGFRRHAAHMQAGLPPDASDAEKLQAAMHGYVAFVEAHPHLYGLMFSPDLVDQDSPDLIEAGHASYLILEDLARHLDWSRKDEPEAQVRGEIMLWSLVHGYATLRQSGKLPLSPRTGAVPGIAEIAPRFGRRTGD